MDPGPNVFVLIIKHFSYCSRAFSYSPLLQYKIPILFNVFATSMDSGPYAFFYYSKHKKYFLTATLFLLLILFDSPNSNKILLFSIGDA